MKAAAQGSDIVKLTEEMRHRSVSHSLSFHLPHHLSKLETKTVVEETDNEGGSGVGWGGVGSRKAGGAGEELTRATETRGRRERAASGQVALPSLFDPCSGFCPGGSHADRLWQVCTPTSTSGDVADINPNRSAQFP